MQTRLHRAFGLAFETAFPLPGLPPVDAVRGRPTRLALASPGDVLARFGPAGGDPIWRTLIDGREVDLVPGSDGGHLVRFGDDAVFRLSADAQSVLCGPADPESAAWKRFLLDTVFAIVALFRGCEALHASAVERDGRVTAIIAGTGGGKTTLALELIRRGAALFTDDILALTRPREVMAHAGPAVVNAPEGAARPGAVGERLAQFDGEEWLAVDRHSGASRPLSAIVFLERRTGLADRMVPLDPSPLLLLPHLIGTLALESRGRERFEITSRLAESVPFYRLEADPATEPQRLAELVEGLWLSPGQPALATTA